MCFETKNTELVSFIIPSYNSAHTVKRCLDSVYALPLKPEEFEVIFIDDCSTDKTIEMVSDYALNVANTVLTGPLDVDKHSNLILLQQPKNNRQGAARNRGVQVAKGEYICFVDSDDAVAEGIVTAISIAKEKQMDMVAFHYAFANESGKVTKEAERLNYAKGQIFSGIEMQNIYPYWGTAPWGYVYSRAFLKKVNYPFAEGVLYEDSDFVATHLYHAKRMAYSNEMGYVAYYREGSTTHSMTHKNVADCLFLGKRMLVLYERIVSESVNDSMDEGVKQFAEGILEGACWNVERSCRRLLNLGSIKELCAYYNRVDAQVSRKDMVRDTRLHSYYWNSWTTFCLGHKHVAIVLTSFLMPFLRLVKRVK